MKSKLYISYAWKEREQKVEDSREHIVNELCDAFKAEGYHVMRDKADMKYRDVIREFMHDIAGADALVAVISEKYLRSPYCMYELAAACDRGDFSNRVFPIVLPDASFVWDKNEQIALVAYWKSQYETYGEKVKQLDDEAKEGLLQHLRDLKYIYERISAALSVVTGMVIPPDILLEGNYSEIIRQVKEKIDSDKQKTMPIDVPKTSSINELLDRGEVNEAFSQLEKRGVKDLFAFNRLKKEYVAGLTGIQLPDWIERMKVFVNSQ